MLHEEVKKYRELSGDINPNTPISRIGGFLDGYEKALEQEPVFDKIRAEIETWHKEGTNWSDIRLMKIEDILDEYETKIKPQAESER